MVAISDNGANAPGVSLPQWLNSESALVRVNGVQGTGQIQADSLDCAARSATEATDNAIATLRARLAIRGVSLQVLSDGFMVHSGALHRVLPDLSAVSSFADQVGCPK